MILQLTDHFSFNEFVRTSRFPELQAKNAAEGSTFLGNILDTCVQLEKVRLFFKAPVFITSGFRCSELNTAIGGSPTSQHLFGSAADFVVGGSQDLHGMQFVFDWCKNHLEYRQLILESPPGRKPWIHLGIPNGDGKNQALFFDGKLYVPS